MKSALVLAVALAASSAAAQPRPCAVTFVRAPDDVRAVVEQWVKAEPRCNVGVEVRIIPTEGGLYLHARDDNGRVRERVVPDAQSAGVLVASWVAADAGPPQAAVDVPTSAPPVTLASEPMLAPAATEAPGAMPAVDATVAATPPAATAPARWLSLGGLVAMSGTGGGGVRGELDLKTKGIATFGIAASVSQTGMMIYGPSYDSMGTLDTFDAKLVGTITVAAHRGRWHFASSIGAGVVYTRALLEQPFIYISREAEGVFATGEAALSVTRDLGTRWAITASPIASLYAQQYEIENSGADYYSRTQQRRDLDLTMFLGVRHRL